jgi:release factor glutamine methyltransferase
VTSIPYETLFFQKTISIIEEDFQRLHTLIQRRKNMEPISKIIEKKEFYGLDFKTNMYTLDPRPDTETVIECFLELFPDRDRRLNLLDLGCGTGCIGLTLSSMYPNISVTLSDISKEAIDVAIYNSQHISQPNPMGKKPPGTNVAKNNKYKFIQSDWFSKIEEQYDVIVCNPPYVSKDFELEKETKFDPEIALYADNEGMFHIEKILSEAHKYLKKAGTLIVEIGFDQSEKVKNVKTKLSFTGFRQDINSINRVAIFKNNAVQQ